MVSAMPRSKHLEKLADEASGHSSESCCVGNQRSYGTEEKEDYDDASERML